MTGCRPRYPAAKRALDFALSLLGIVLASPLWVAIPVAIKLDDGGPVFFRQTRIGLGGGPFEVLKFRTMVPDERGERRPAREGPSPEEITRVGRILRPTALDELPQLLAILKGDMSLVGPRALAAAELERSSGGGEEGGESPRDVPGYRERQLLPPGLTGVAQVTVSRHVPYRSKFRLDVFYVRNRTLWLDLKLIARSVWISLRGAWPEVGSE